ncbi:hypothetical protein PF008_g4200 [Phytophthora fragariae]|uniref:Uncharacterized protein n=1 Tax=Phytophthora fragariae TaxID=53985 RepID=A0A6G0SC51_9STRA|nr:hypothetical protein PF008_g4200 [Phytophthora fragariae]
MRAHVGKRVCLEKRYPSLKTQRLEKAREYKREYESSTIKLAAMLSPRLGYA